MPDTLYVSLKDNAESLWPHQFIPQPPLDALENVWFEPMRILIEPTRRLQTAVLLTQSVEIGLPGFNQVSVVLGAADNDTTFLVEIELEPIILGRLSTTLAIRLRTNLLRPVERVVDSSTGRETFQIDHEAEHLDVPIADAEVTLDQDGNISIASDLSISLPLSSIADTGLIIEARDISFNLSPESPAMVLSEADVLLPDYLPLPPSTRITMVNASIDSSGFTGDVAVDLNLSYDEVNREFVYLPIDPADPPTPATLFGDLSGGLRHVRIAVEQNRLTAFDITGSLTIPYFDEPADIRINVTATGEFTVSLAGTDADGITLTKEELLALNVRSLAISHTAQDVTEVVISGGLEPLLMSSDGLQWPRLDVTDLYIDSTGKFKIKEAWLDLKELATLDLWGFHFELRRIGIGSEERNDPDGDRLWVDLSGGLRLIEQIPVALDVEGFRLTWPQNLLEGLTGPPGLNDIQAAVAKIQVEFDGIYLFFGVPDAVEFEGLIRFFKEAQLVGFAGDMALRVPASGFAAEAGLLIGLSFDPVFPFLYVYFGVDLPAGIPLAQSGLALKGALGMFGLNVAPDKTEEQNWYYDWYKRGPIVGAHPTNKWRPQQNALALGVGVTITTADGYVKGTRGLFVLAIPGPILIIEGRALILSGLQPDAEPPLRALAVFDGGAGTVQFNIEAEATLIADLLKAYGMLEAFFDFNDLTNWHLYLGQDTPRDRRIRADLLKVDNSFLFNADAYLMIDMVNANTLRSRMGASIGFEPKIPPIDPLEVEFSATLEGDGLVTARPEQFSGELDLAANIKLSALGMSVKVSADAGFLTEGPRPLRLGAHVRIQADLPDPLDPVKTSVEFEWQAPEPPSVESPLSEIDVHSRLAPLGAGFSEDALKVENNIRDLANLGSQSEELAKKSPIVEVDSKPIICFKQKMNSDVHSFARHPSGQTHHYDVGLFQFIPTLKSITLKEHPKDNDTWTGVDEEDWETIASTDDDSLLGVWLVNSEPATPDEPSPRQVQLWTDNPLSSSGRALGSGYKQFRGAVQPGKSLAERILEDYPDLMKCSFTKAEDVCVDFKAAGDVTLDPGDSFEYKDLRISSNFRTVAIRGDSPNRPASTGFPLNILDTLRRGSNWLVRRLRPTATDMCLFVDGYVDIQFRRRIKKCRIVLCQPSKLSETAIRVRVTTKRGIRSLSELDTSVTGQEKGITLSDIRRCSVSVRSDVTASPNEWLIEADEGFDCIHIVRMDEFAIREICYTTVEEVERSRRATDECKDNGNVPAEKMLTPGAYYRLDVVTEVEGKLNLDDLPFDENSSIGEMLIDAYQTLLGDIAGPNSYHQTCFFQTETPPTNLAPYVKWCSPSPQFETFFYSNFIAIRFLRSNLRPMFNSPFALKAEVKATEGNTMVGVIEWAHARSSTLFPEESVWETHRNSLDWPPRTTPHDDLLLIKFEDPAAKLLPLSRYQLEIAGTGGNEKWNKVVLFSTSFTTSRFNSFKELAQSYRRQNSIAAKSDIQSQTNLIADLQLSCRYIAEAQRNWERSQVDFRFETLNGGRKALEDARLGRRELLATHDEQFRNLAGELADLYFVPFSESVEIYLVRDARSRAVTALWIRSPETLDVRLGVFETADAPQSRLLDYVGRTEIKLERIEPTRRKLGITVLPNSDSTQVLVLPSTGRSWERGSYSLKVTYYRDYADENKPIDHRYDRPIEFTNIGSGPVTHLWNWQV